MLQRLERAWERALDRWPDLDLSREAFATTVAAFEPDADADETALEDLVLACACLQGRRAALAHFEREVLSGVAKAVARIDSRPELADEVRQALRMRLFVGDSPKIVAYRARGPLASWVNVAAIRLSVDLGRKEQVRTHVAETLARRFVEISVEDPDLVVLRHAQREAFSNALRAALSELEPRDRAILKLQYLDGVGIDRIAAAYDVHRSTAARWVHKACRALEARASARLSRVGTLRPSEVRSLGRALQSQLSVSFEGLRVTP